jgi:hypothetical protein
VHDEKGSDAAAGEATSVRTFLIADFRGYTRYSDEHGDEAASALARRFALIAGDATLNVVAIHRIIGGKVTTFANVVVPRQSCAKSAPGPRRAPLGFDRVRYFVSAIDGKSSKYVPLKTSPVRREDTNFGHCRFMNTTHGALSLLIT